MNSPTASDSTKSTSIADVVSEEVNNLPAETDESQALPKLESAQLENERLKQEIETIKQQNADRQSDRELRQKYADQSFAFLVCFSIFSGIVLLAHGTNGSNLNLSDNVVITLIGSTAASVIGLVGWIAKGLFGSNNK